jgi:hypothetical protein
VNCVRIARLALAVGLPALALAAVDEQQLLDELRKTKAEISLVRVLAEEPLVVVVTGAPGKPGAPPEWAKGELLGVFARRGERVVPISIIPNSDFPTAIWIGRQGPDSITFALGEPDDRIQSDSLKIFFDPKTLFPKRITRFAPVRVRRITTAAGVVTLVGSDGKQDFTARERSGAWTVTAAKAPPLPPARPAVNTDEIPPMPVSTIGEFEEARPDRARHLSDSDVREVSERIGPSQQVGPRIWAGKTFFDQGGSIGVGDIGYIDPSKKDWVFLHIPQMADWSTSALLVETDTIWAGLVRTGEGVPLSGGLLRYDRASHEAQVIPVAGVIDRILRVAKQIYCGTSGGFAIVDQSTAREFQFDPQLDGSYLVVPALP